MLARDETPPVLMEASDFGRKNFCGVYPFYMALELDGKAHGVLFLNSNPQEITTSPAPHIVYRTIGGILDIYFFPGPRPEDVIRQYLALVGTPAVPPYWALGFQIDYFASNLTEFNHTVNVIRDANIPLDVVYANIDYMDKYQDFTLGKEWQQLSTYFNQLHDQDIHAVLTLDASISVTGEAFKRALDAHASFFEWERIDQAPKSIQSLYNSTNNTKIMLGVSWPDAHVAFPDFGAEETINWWVDEIATFHEMVPFDGIWIKRNEPASFGTDETDPWYFKSPKHSKIAPLMCPLNGTDAYYDVPPYETFSVFLYRDDTMQSYLSSKTLCMLAVSKSGRIYDTKNLYGLQQSIATHKALQVAISKRGLLLSESLFPSGGHYAGHALGDNFATWSNLARSVVGIQLFNIFGIPYVGADICGFHGETITDDLCSRWHQLGAFYSLARVRSENRLIPQNLSAWLVQARQANLFRYMYLPYLYTLHFDAARFGGTVVRPLFFEFPDDDAARGTSEQFMWGSALLIAPVLRPNMTVTYAYLPRSVSWYSLRNEDFGVKAPKGFSLFTASAFMLPPVFIKGGSIVPYQLPSDTTISTRQNPLQFVIALENSTAWGKLIWDDGESTISDFERYNYIELHIDFKLDVEAVLTLTLIKKCAALKIPPISVLNFVGYTAIPITSTIKRDDGGALNISEDAWADPSLERFYLPADGIFDFDKDTTVKITWLNHELFDLVGEDARVDCMPTFHALVPTQAMCEEKFCMYDHTTQMPKPKCYFPKRSGYIATGTYADQIILQDYSSFKNPFGQNISPLYFSARHINQTTLNVRIFPDDYRYEPQLLIPKDTFSTGESFVVEIANKTKVFSFIVRRKSTNAMIWDTSIGGMMFSDQYIQIAAYIGTSMLYGIGENTQATLMHLMEIYTTYAMFSRNEALSPDYDFARRWHPKNLYGVFPFYIGFERDGNAHGVFILNSNAQEITLGMAPHIVYRTIGGMLDIFFFPGPTPDDVIRQFTALVGKPALPPYWSFGFQLGRFGYDNLKQMRNTIASVQQKNIPLDVVHADIDYMIRYQDFTLNSEWESLSNYITSLHDAGLHAVLTFNPAVQVDGLPFSRALKAGVHFFEWEVMSQVPKSVQSLYPLTNNTKIMLGVLWQDKHVAYPDFSSPSTGLWWNSEVGDFRRKV
uniref:P-type domain-containing protein n=1 Tax=Parascaris univalens TaxID=6257 RepID=A0A915AP98_PARUN